MVSAAQVIAGAAFVKIGADISDMEKGLRAGAKTFKMFLTKVGVGMQALGGSMLAPLYKALQSYAKVGSEMFDIAARTGLAAQSVAELGFVAKAVGADVDYVARGFRYFQKNMMAAATGSKLAQQGFSELGLNVAELKKMTPEESFMNTIGAISKLNKAAQASSAIRIFGRGGAQLAPMFALGAEGIKKFRNAYAVLHGEMRADKAKEVELRFKALGAVWDGLKNTIGFHLAPAFEKFTNVILRGVVAVRLFFEQHPTLIAGLAKISMSLVAVGAAMTAIGAILALITAPLILLIGIVSFSLVSIYESINNVQGGINSLLENIAKRVKIFGYSFKTYFLMLQKSICAIAKMAYDLVMAIVNGLISGIGKVLVSLGNIVSFGKLGKSELGKSLKATFEEMGKNDKSEEFKTFMKSFDVEIEKSMLDDMKAEEDNAAGKPSIFDDFKTMIEQITGKVEVPGLKEINFDEMFAALKTAQTGGIEELKQAGLGLGGSTQITGGGNIRERIAGSNTIAEKQLEQSRLQTQLLEDIRDSVSANFAEVF